MANENMHRGVRLRLRVKPGTAHAHLPLTKKNENHSNKHCNSYYLCNCKKLKMKIVLLLMLCVEKLCSVFLRIMQRAKVLNSKHGCLNITPTPVPSSYYYIPVIARACGGSHQDLMIYTSREHQRFLWTFPTIFNSPIDAWKQLLVARVMPFLLPKCSSCYDLPRLSPLSILHISISHFPSTNSMACWQHSSESCQLWLQILRYGQSIGLNGNNLWWDSFWEWRIAPRPTETNTWWKCLRVYPAMLILSVELSRVHGV